MNPELESVKEEHRKLIEQRNALLQRLSTAAPKAAKLSAAGASGGETSRAATSDPVEEPPRVATPPAKGAHQPAAPSQNVETPQPDHSLRGADRSGRPVNDQRLDGVQRPIPQRPDKGERPISQRPDGVQAPIPQPSGSADRPIPQPTGVVERTVPLPSPEQLQTPPRHAAPSPPPPAEQSARVAFPSLASTGSGERNACDASVRSSLPNGEWLSPNPFVYCVSLEVVAAKGLRPEPHVCEAQLGPHTREFAITSAGATGVVSAATSASSFSSLAQLPTGCHVEEVAPFVSERMDFVLDSRADELKLYLKRIPARSIFQGWNGNVGRVILHLSRHWAEEEEEDALWYPVLGAGSGVGLLIRLRCWPPAQLGKKHTQSRLFEQYASNGVITQAGFGRMMRDLFDATASPLRFALSVRPGGTPVTRRHSTSRRLESSAPDEDKCYRCVASSLGWIGFYRPECPMLSYLAYYHTLMWVVCKHPSERHIPVINRLYFLLLSLGFNMFVVVLFTATDYSLVSINCPTPNSCAPFQTTGWHAAQIGLVALVDTAFWPLLKMLFFYVHDHRHSEARRSVLRGISLCCVAVLSLSCVRMAANHEQEMSSVLPEFLTTWPTARVTECFKLMSLWGFLMEYAPPDPAPADEEKISSRKYSDAATNKYKATHEDSKRVPLLSAQCTV